MLRYIDLQPSSHSVQTNVASNNQVTIFGNDKNFVLGDTDRGDSEGDKPSFTEVEDANILTINATSFCYFTINNTNCFKFLRLLEKRHTLHMLWHTYITFNIRVASYHSSKTHVSVKYHSLFLSYEKSIATCNASSPYSPTWCFLFQIPVSPLDVRTVHFVEFYYICTTPAQYMPTDDFWHILCMCCTKTVIKNSFLSFP